MEIYQDIAAQMQRGLKISVDATKLVLLGIQAGYNLRAMEKPSTEKQEKQAG